MLQAEFEDVRRYHRLRASLPSKLWRWRICGWRWQGNAEHINARTALRWRLSKRAWLRTRFLRLVDSQVCLHALARGRSTISPTRVASHQLFSWHPALTRCGPTPTPMKTRSTRQVGACEEAMGKIERIEGREREKR